MVSFFSAFFAVAAAALWFYASRLRVPRELTVTTMGDIGFGGELPKLFTAVAQQSKWNARAAECAAASALLQAFAAIDALIK
jgi:hypothetical protein